MGAPQVTKYQIPKSNCSKILSELQDLGLLAPGSYDLADDTHTIIHTLKTKSKYFAPPLLFFACRNGENTREMETMWIRQNRQVAEQIEQTVLRHGGIVVLNGLRDSKII